MNAGQTTKHNSIIERSLKASAYTPLIKHLKKNLEKLPDFVISEKEMLELCRIQTFDYEDFKKEFEKAQEFKELDFLVSPHDPKVFHVIIKGKEIPSDYTKDVIRELAEKEYDTSKIKEIVEWWRNIYKKQTDNELKQSNSQPMKKINKKTPAQKQSENFAAYNQNTQSLDGSYGTQIYKSRETGRFYSNPSHDNYSEDSNS